MCIRDSVRATRVDLSGDLSLRVSVSTPWGDAEVRPAVKGAHHVTNLLAAFAGALAAGVPLDAAAVSYTHLTLPTSDLV